MDPEAYFTVIKLILLLLTFTALTLTFLYLVFGGEKGE